MSEHIINFKKESSDRTREFLKENLSNAVELTLTQKTKLTKLEKEIKQHAINLKRNEKEEDITGIPANIAGLDVVTFANLIGLIKPKEIRNGLKKDESFSLVNWIAGPATVYRERNIDFKNIPFYFKHADYQMVEDEKIAEENDKIVESPVDDILDSYLKNINRFLIFKLETIDVPSFRKECILTINELVEDIIEEDDLEEVDRMLVNISIVRNHLLGCIPISNYKKLLTIHVNMMKHMGLDDNDIITYMSIIDAHLILFPKFNLLDIHEFEKNKILQSLKLRKTISPKFNLPQLMSDICSPFIICLHAQDILNYSLDLTTIGVYKKSFYVLKDNINGVRLWVIDGNLQNTITFICKKMTSYIIHTFQIFYKQMYGHDCYKYPLILRKLFLTLINNLFFINSKRLELFLKTIIAEIVPTELDMFNREQKQTLPKLKYTPQVKLMKRLFPTITPQECKQFLKI